MGTVLECQQCGRRLRLKEGYQGRRLKCPACGTVFQPPAEGEGEDGPHVAPTLQEHVQEKPPASTERPCPKCGRPVETDALFCLACGVNLRPRQQVQSAHRPSVVRSRPRRSSGIHITRPMVAGVFMMGGATVWFVLGLLLGRIFIYPPILFVFGVLAFIRGLQGDRD